MTSQVEEFLDALYEADRDTHQLVNQAILVLERNGPGEGRPAERLYATYLKEREGEIRDGRG